MLNPGVGMAIDKLFKVNAASQAAATPPPNQLNLRPTGIPKPIVPLPVRQPQADIPPVGTLPLIPDEQSQAALRIAQAIKARTSSGNWMTALRGKVSSIVRPVISPIGQLRGVSPDRPPPLEDFMREYFITNNAPAVLLKNRGGLTPKEEKELLRVEHGWYDKANKAYEAQYGESYLKAAARAIPKKIGEATGFGQGVGAITSKLLEPSQGAGAITPLDITFGALDVTGGAAALKKPAQVFVKAVGQSAKEAEVGKLLTSEVGMVGKKAAKPLEGQAAPIEPPKPPTATQVTPPPDEAATLQKVLDAVAEQKKLRSQTNVIQKAARGEKFKSVEELRKTPQGEATMQNIGTSLKGELGYKPSPGLQLTQPELDSMYNKITTSGLKDAEVYPAQLAFQRLTDPVKYLTAHPELAKTVKPNMPLRPYELKLFKKVFGPDFANAIGTDGKWLRRAMTANDAFYQIYYNSLLGGKSIIRNSISNTLRVMIKPIQTVGYAAADVPLSGFGKARPRAYFFSEIKPEAVGAVQGLKDGTRAWLHSWKTGEGLNIGAKTETAIKMEQPIKGKLGAVINLPSSAMETGDVFGYTLANQMELHKLAWRQAKIERLKGDALATRYAELKAAPTEGMVAQAQETALRDMYRENNTIARWVTEARDKRILGFQPARLIIPFIKTPTNIVKQGLEWSPFGLVNPKAWIAVAKKDPKAVEQLTHAFIGSTVAGTLAAYVYEGNLTGAVPTSPAERDAFYREGKQPFSARIGDTWVSYQQIPLLAQTLTMAAAATDAIKNNDKTAQEQATAAGYTIARSVVDQTFMTGLSDFLDAVTDPERNGGNWLAKTVPSLVPFSATTRIVAQAMDTTVRKPDTIGEGIQANVPLASESVPARTDVFGKTVIRETPWWSPINVTSAKSDAVDAELKKIGKAIGFVGTSISGQKLDEKQQQQYQEIAGNITKNDLSLLFNSLEYQKANRDQKESLVDRTVSNAREKAKAALRQQGTIPTPPTVPSAPSVPLPSTITRPTGTSTPKLSSLGVRRTSTRTTSKTSKRRKARLL